MKYKKIVIKQIFALLIFFCVLLFSTFPSRAANIDNATTGGNTDQSDGGESTPKVIGGPSWERIGWLVYIIDEAGNQLTDTKVFYSSSEQPSSRNGGLLLGTAIQWKSTYWYICLCYCPWLGTKTRYAQPW